LNNFIIKGKNGDNHDRCIFLPTYEIIILINTI